MSSFPLALQQRFLTSGPYARFSAQHNGEFIMPGKFPLGMLSDQSYHMFNYKPEVSSRDPNIDGSIRTEVAPATPEVLNSLQTAPGIDVKESQRRRYIEELGKGRGASSLGDTVPEARSIEDSETVNQIARMATL